MSGYKPGYSEAHSPWYQDGCADATADALLVGRCPPMAPRGPDPAKEHSGMYRRGYASVPQIVHQCTEKCRKEGRLW